MRLAILSTLLAGFATFGTSDCWGQGNGILYEELKLVAPDGSQLGWSIAIDDGIVAVGAPYADDKSGSAFLFRVSSATPFAKLLPTDGARDDLFGCSIAIDNGIVAVGACEDEDNGSNSGSAYLFSVYTGVQIAKLLPNDGWSGNVFGQSIAIADGVVAVGAPGHDGKVQNSGAAYLFDASTGVQIAQLLPSDESEDSLFGHSIAIDDGIVAVGSRNDDDNGTWSGSAYLFDVSTGAQISKLLPDDSYWDQHFGSSIALDSGIVAVGASGDTVNGDFAGSAYLFDVSTGTQIAKLLPRDGSEEDIFGHSIAIGSGVVVVGAPGIGYPGGANGSAYYFDAITGEEIIKLLPSDRVNRDSFGSSVVIDQGIVAIGARWSSGGGAAYLFDSAGRCLDLAVDHLVAGQKARFTIAHGEPGAKSVTVYGTEPGSTAVSYYQGFCATFGINTGDQKIISHLTRRFDTNGEIIVHLAVPAKLGGRTLFFQSAQQGTCPDECVSNLVEAVVE